METGNELQSALVEYCEIDVEIKRLTARKKELDPMVRPALDGQGTVLVNDCTMELKTVKGRKSLDKKRLTADMTSWGRDIGEYENVGAPYTTLTVKQLG